MERKLIISIVVLFIVLSVFSLYNAFTSYKLITNSKKSMIERKSFFIEKVKKHVPEIEYLVPVAYNEDTTFRKILTIFEMYDDTYEKIGYSAFAREQLLCGQCNDVFILIFFDSKKKIYKVIPLEPVELNGDVVDSVSFFVQFEQKSTINENEIHNITGATYSSKSIIEFAEKALIKVNKIKT